MAFRYLSHTADVKFEATAETLAEAFVEAAKAVTRVMTEEEVKEAHEHHLTLSSESKESLFFDFLDEIILLLDTEEFFPAGGSLEVEDRGDHWHLGGIVTGDDAKNYERHGDVKAPTYHDMKVEKDAKGWTLRATLDI